jgi:hypothetical protein
MTSTLPKLFQPLRVGTVNLQHRVVLAPMTRCRADSQHVHGTLALEYYKQRTSVPGTLAITEATFIAARAGGQNNVPGIWSDKQIAAWKSVRLRLCFWSHLSFSDDLINLGSPLDRSRMQYTKTHRPSFSSFGPSAALQIPKSSRRRAGTHLSLRAPSH